MLKNKIAGYAWMLLGFFLVLIFGGKLFIQLIGIVIGFVCIIKGLNILAVDRVFYNYSIDYFKSNWKK